ncbi:RNA polymerase III, subunit C34 [Pseudoloma neurophilia]|uniref:RNA polymerase III, subunit C34 n=1 Tax=Pseudoloma neurophilia TaxID=146866 RepID=A0A0R0M3F8_9MICR|nr:RNA polymerase III, subunit C34 [Pseudoloma neurophilia]
MVSVREKVLTFIKSKTTAFPINDLKTEFPQLSDNELNELLIQLEKQEIITRNDKKQTIVYLRKPEESEQLVYDCIKDSGVKGCSMKELKIKTKLTQNLLTKILKNLENLKYINNIKNESNVKIYYLFNNEMKKEVFFNQNVIDKEFVDQLIKLIFLYLTKKCNMKAKNVTEKIQFGLSNEFKGHDLIRALTIPSTEIHQFILKSNCLKIDLNLQEIEKLLYIMVTMGILQEISIENEKLYRALPFNIEQIIGC